MLGSSLCCFSEVPGRCRAIWCMTYACNRRCVHCLNRHHRTKEGNPNEVIAQKLATNLASHGFNDILFTGGEPFVLEEFLPIVSAFARSGFTIAISTNGDFLNEKIIESLHSLPIRSVNLGCFISDVSRRGVAVQRQRWLRLLRALRLSRQGIWRTRLTFVLSTWEVSLISEILREVEDIGVGYVAFTWRFPDIVRVECQLDDLRAWLPESTTVTFNRIRFLDSDNKWDECPGLVHRYLQIAPDLSVVPCILNTGPSQGTSPTLRLDSCNVFEAVERALSRVESPVCVANRRVLRVERGSVGVRMQSVRIRTSHVK